MHFEKLPPHHRARRLRPVRSSTRPNDPARRPVFAVLLAALVAALPACVDPLSRIDERTRRLIETRSAELGPSAIPAERDHLDPQQYQSRDMDEKTPATVNPAASELEFEMPAQERTDRLVARRLEAYAQNALGAGPDPDGAEPLDPLRLTLQDAFRLAQRTGPQFLRAEEDYILAAIAVLQERHLFSPRFFNDTSVELAGQGRGEDGQFDHAVDILNTLRVSQQLPTGGNLTAEWIVRATDQLRDVASGGYMQASDIVLSADIPLLRGAGPVARENLIQAERNLVFEARDFERTRRALLVTIADDYFSLLEQQSAIENQILQIEGLVQLEEQTSARVEAGRLRPFQAQLAANQVLTAEASLASLRESYILSLDQFKIRLGIPIERPIEILPLDFDLPEPRTSQAQAARDALRYRLDLQNERDQLDDERRDVRNARNALLPDLDLAGSVTLPTDIGDPTGGLSFNPEDLSYAMSATFGLPLDRQIERLGLRAAIVDLERAARDFDDFRDNLLVLARQSVRNIDLARFQLELAEQQVRINELRKEDLQLRDDSDPQAVVDAENELIEARNDRDAALTDLRNAVLNYLLDTGTLRVERDGTFQPLPGMAAPLPDDAGGGGEADAGAASGATG